MRRCTRGLPRLFGRAETRGQLGDDILNPDDEILSLKPLNDELGNSSAGNLLVRTHPVALGTNDWVRRRLAAAGRVLVFWMVLRVLFLLLLHELVENFLIYRREGRPYMASDSRDLDVTRSEGDPVGQKL